MSGFRGSDAAPRSALSCGSCGAPRQGMICPKCVNGLVLGERKAQAAILRARKEDLLRKINDLLGEREKWQKQMIWQSELEHRLRQVSIKATSTEHKLKTVRSTITQLKLKNASRTEELTNMMAELPNLRTEILVHHFSDVIRCQALQYSMVMEQLVAEQRACLQSLLHIFPLQITALRSSTGSATGMSTVLPIPCVTVANLRLPDSMEQAHESCQQNQQSLGAALGYMLLLTQLLAYYLNAPVAHTACFGASRSFIWEPASSSKPMPPPGAKPLPLFPMKTTSGGSSQGETSSAVRGSASGSNRGGSSSSVGDSGGGGGSGWAAEADELARGVRLLERSVAVICHAKMGPASRACPEDWSPFALLAWMFAQVNLQHTETTQRIMAAAASASSASQAGEDPPGPSGRYSRSQLHGAGTDPWTSNDAALSAQMLLGDPAVPDIQDIGDMENQPDQEDWDFVQRPFLPPPPSQPDEVEHWTRAMFTDARRNGRSTTATGDSLFDVIRQTLPSFTKS